MAVALGQWYEESEHPRGTGGRWTEKGGGIGPTRELPKAEVKGSLSDTELAALEPTWDAYPEGMGKRIAKEAVWQFVTGDSAEINDALCSTDDPLDWATGPQQRLIRGLDRTFDYCGHNLDKTVTMFSGATDEVGGKLEVGQRFTNRAFVSTTNNNDTAARFADQGYTFRISIPTGTRVISPGRDEDIGSDPQLLLNRGTKYEVMAKEGRTIDLRVVPEHEAPAEKKETVGKEQTKRSGVTEELEKAGLYVWTKAEGWVNRTWPKLGVTPKEFVDLAKGDLKADVYIRDDTSIHVDLEDGGKHIFWINPVTQEAHIELMEMAEAKQGGGQGKALMAGAMEIFKRSKMKTITLTANISVGGYAWARYGFLPRKGEWNVLRKTMRRNLERFPVKNKAELDTINKLLNSDDPRMIWPLSDSSMGKNMLLKTYWYGELNLDDADAMERFTAYVRRRRHNA